MKKMVAVLLVAALIISVSGCGNTTVNQSSEVIDLASAQDTNTMRDSEDTTSSTSDTTDATTTTTTTTTTKTTTTTETTTTTKSTTKATTTTTTAKATTTTAAATPPSSSFGSVSDSLRYGYATLSSEQKKVYAALRDAIASMESKVSVSTSLNDPVLALQAFLTLLGDYPQYYYVNGSASASSTSSKVEMDLTYLYSASQVSAMNQQIEAKVQAVLGKIPSGASDFDKVRIIHDSIVTGTNYIDGTQNCRNLYGSLVEGKAVCEGYAEALQYIAQRAGVMALIVMGDTDEAHMWNMVRINGAYYHIDPTYDDPVLPTTNAKYIRYNYFNLTTAEIQKDHSIYSGIFSAQQTDRYNYYPLPQATSTSHNYFVYNGLLFDSYAGVEDTLVDLIVTAAKSGSPSVQIRFSSKDAYDAAYQKLVTEKGFFDVLGEAGAKQSNLKTNTYNMPQTSETYHIMLFGLLYK